MELLQLIENKDVALKSLNQLRTFVKFTDNLLSQSFYEGDYLKTKEVIKWIEDFKDEIECEYTIERNQSFYYSYLTALENVYSSLVKNDVEESTILKIVNSKKYIREIIEVLINEQYITHSKLASKITVSKSQLSNIFSSSEIRSLGIISIENLGRNKAYSLSKKGIDFCKRDFAKDKKRYSNEDLIVFCQAIINDDIKDVERFVGSKTMSINSFLLSYKKDKIISKLKNVDIKNTILNNQMIIVKESSKRSYKNTQFEKRDLDYAENTI